MLENISPMNLIDGYKTSHREQYPVGTTLVYSNFTPRQSRVKGINNVVMYGLQYFIKEYLIERFNKHFFDLPKQDVLDSYKKRLDNYLGTDYDISHIGELHDLGYLPIKINALPEGTLIPLNVPCLLLENTDERFFWLTNYLETLLSNILWKPMTSATIANKYKNTFIDYAIKTGYGLSCPDAIKWQGHDFSFRGMSGIEDALMSASGHLLSFTGTDCLPAIDFIEMYYNTDSTKELIGGSIPASEHSTMSAAGDANEFELYNGVRPAGEVKVWETAESMKRRMNSVFNRYKKYQRVIVVCHGMVIRTIKYQENIAHAEIIEYILNSNV